jgi:exodeoxyribonuclease V alpha subunit
MNGSTPWLAGVLPALEPIDAELAQLLLRLGADELTALAAGLCGHWRGRGHACLPLGQLPRRLQTGLLAAADAPALPPASVLLEALAVSPWVAREVSREGAMAAPAPLLLDAAGRLYLWRYYQAERALAAAIRTRTTTPAAVDPVFRQRMAEIWPQLFPNPPEGAVDLQALAAWGGATRPLFLICGGPGTGKTTTVARLLAAALHAEPTLRVLLAAPTGKAAQRLNESLALQWQELTPLLGPGLERPPGPATTLHRLLGYQPRRDRFVHRAGAPLACDLLIVDEASMIDLLLMAAVFAALPPHARIVLLGDHDQLASVEAGSVFADLARIAFEHEPSAAFLGELRAVQGEGDFEPAEASMPERSSLRDHAVELRTSFRFRAHPGIGRLAEAIRRQDADQALLVLDEGGADVGRHLHAVDAIQLLHPLLDHWRAYAQAPDAGAALDILDRFRLLCVTRRGPMGVDALNAKVEKLLPTLAHAESPSPLESAARYYHGRPILIRANDYEVDLYNGNLGVLWRDEGQLWAFFRADADQPLRRLALAKLPRHETAWAMTVHQSQGSEFDQVLLVLPPNDHPLLTRELLYTGITRARHRVDLVATPAVIDQALSRTSRRASGMRDRL